MTDFKTHAKKVHGLGSAKTGVHHWIHQRFTAIMNIGLVFWLICVLIHVADMDHQTAKTYMSGTWNAIFGILFSVSTFYHAKLGLQTVIEDYVHGHCVKTASMIIMNGFVYFGMITSVFAILKIAL